MSEQDGLICAFVMDGQGGGRPVGWPEIETWRPEDGLLWLHFDHTGSAVQTWLDQKSGIDPIIVRTMVQEEVRPRVLSGTDALLVVLRGVNLNPGEDPEDMVGVKLWLEPGRIITLRHRRLMAVNDVRERVERGRGPRSVGDFLVAVVEQLVERMGPVIVDLEDLVDRLEEQILTAQSSSLRAQLGQIRRQAILIRRYLAPQRDAMSRLPLEDASWLNDMQRAHLREMGDRTLRYLEDLEAARDRAAVIQEELSSRLADQMNRTMYVLTVVAAVLLPPSLITGLFGINVGGMPWVESGWGFGMIVVAMVILGVIEVVVLKRLNWI